MTYCRSNIEFSYYGRSKAKVQYIGSSKLGVQTAAWVGAPDDKCAAGGIATTDAGYARIDLLVGTWAGAGAGWLSWVQ